MLHISEYLLTNFVVYIRIMKIIYTGCVPWMWTAGMKALHGTDVLH